MKYWNANLTLGVMLLLTACGGGGGDGMTAAPGPISVNFTTALGTMVTMGLSANVTLSGTVSGAAVTGTGTYVLTPVSNNPPVLFAGSPANGLTLTGNFQATAAGQAITISSTVTDYYEPATHRYMGEQQNNPPPGNEFDIASPPLSFPGTVQSGDSGTLGTVMRYTNSTQSSPLGTITVSYLVKADAANSNALIIELITKTYDTGNSTAVETDATDYAVTTAGVISFVSSSAQNSSGSLTVAAQ
jgi:hypothetical protein